VRQILTGDPLWHQRNVQHNIPEFVTGFMVQENIIEHSINIFPFGNRGISFAHFKDSGSGF